MRKTPLRFHARCALKARRPEKRMTDTEWARARSVGYERVFEAMRSERVDRETGRHGRWMIVYASCDGLETDDPAVFEAHMASVHNRKPSGPAQVKLGRGLWRTPTLKPFDPAEWADRDDVTLTLLDEQVPA